MTHEEIENMVPGPDMDRIVSEKVMGWTRKKSDRLLNRWCFFNDSGFICYEGNWKPSTDIAAAMEVMEIFDEITVRKYNTVYAGPRYVCRIEVDGKVVEEVASRPEIAICKAALIAVMEG